MDPTESKVRLEWLLLADSAEVINNKLYMLGGGWEVYHLNTPARVKFALAASFKVPWVATNQPHKFEVQILTEDGQTPLMGFGGEFEVGRPPGMPAGSSQRSQIAINGDAEM